jgi:hypothetical protein
VSGLTANGGGGGLDEALLVTSRASGDADVGLMALWALLNLSGYEPAQVIRPPLFRYKSV